MAMTIVDELGAKARAAAHILAGVSRLVKDQALNEMADQLVNSQADILKANEEDISLAEEKGTSAALIDRLRLDPARIAGIAQGLRDVASLDDPVGQVIRGWTLPNGVQARQIRVPFGVVGMIYEARPNVTADAAGICLKSGNACLLRGSSSALNSNRAIVKALREGLKKAGLPPDCVNLVEGGHETTNLMMQARGVIDVLIPRGGAGLINAVVDGAKVPVIETGTGNNHLYVEASADFQMARTIILNAKTQRVSVCNALETVLVDEKIAEAFLPMITDALVEAGVVLHGDQAAVAIDDRIVAAGQTEFEAEYLSLDIAVKIVSDIDDALAHIRSYSTGHSETIVTNDMWAATRFTNEVDAAVVLVNASSRFVDGGEFGFGAEIGISTQKMHARGPMALPEMTSAKYVLTGNGQIRQ